MTQFLKYLKIIFKNNWQVFLIIIIALVGMKALIHTGFYTSHDGWHIVARLYHFMLAINDGQLPPRWNGELLNNFGYPLFIFSYQLPWWLALPWFRLGMNIFDSLKAVFLITYIFSGIFMYLWLKQLWGKNSALVGSIIYLFTPYRFADILVRANIGEAVSFLFPPLLFLALSNKKLDLSYNKILIGGIAIAGLLLSHVIAAMLFLVPVSTYILLVLIQSKTKIRYIIQIFVSGLFGIGISAYYLIPAIFYRDLTVSKNMYQGLFKEQMTPLAKLIYSPWGYGAIGTPGEMSRQVGLIIWLVVILSLLFLVIKFIKRRFDFHDQIATIIILNFFGAVFMMTNTAIPVWKLVDPVIQIDFPWRLLSVTTFCGSILAGYLISKIWRPLLQKCIILLFLIAVFYTNRNHMRVNQYTEIPLSLYVVSELTTNTQDEYLSKFVDRQFVKNNHALIEDDNIKLLKSEVNSNKINFEYASNTNTAVTINHLYFPLWKGWIDGTDNIKNISSSGKGLISFQLPYGNHTVSLVYQKPSLMIGSEIITLISLSFLCLLFYFNYKQI